MDQQQVREFITTATDRFSLSTDPDVDSYHFALRYFPQEQITPEICLAAVQQDGV